MIGWIQALKGDKRKAQEERDAKQLENGRKLLDKRLRDDPVDFKDYKHGRA